ncbi:MAG: amino acid transporter [Gammaproteobacteria bacterium]|nr:MAG: amino acid transporter [Gammaproteobacteria bacterium]
MADVNYALILGSALAVVASPGPATLAIASVSMSSGRLAGLALALGIWTGALIWSVSAAFGLAAIIQGNAWLINSVKLGGAGYLVYLAFVSARSAASCTSLTLPEIEYSTPGKNYLKGLLIHLGNPKAMIFFTTLYSAGVPSDAGVFELFSVVASVGVLGAFVFLGYAVMFSSPAARSVYLRSKMPFEILFAALFGAMGVWLLMSTIKEV